MQVLEVLKRNGNLLGWLFLLAFTSFFILYKKQEGKNYVNKISRNSYITSANVSKITFVYKRGYEIEYCFSYDSKNIRAKEYSQKYGCIQTIAIGKSFPVILNKDDASLNYILIFPSDFKAFNIPFPDSLSWVREYE